MDRKTFEACFGALTNIAFISPHPDDVELCCGILLGRLSRRGATVNCYCVTNGAPSPDILAAINRLPKDYDPVGYAAIRKHETTTALRLLGVPDSRIVFLDYPDLGCIDHVSSLVTSLTHALQGSDDVFCCPFEGGHPDHDICRFALAVAIESCQYSGRIWEYASYNRVGYQVFLAPFPAPMVIFASKEEKEVQEMVAKAFVSQEQEAGLFRTDAAFFREAQSVFSVENFLSYSGTPYYERFAYQGHRVLDSIGNYLKASNRAR